MDTDRPAAPVIDEARALFAAGDIDRNTAISQILNAGLSLTEYGAAEMLDHELDVADRYAHMGDAGSCPEGCDPFVPSNRTERRRAARGAAR